MNDEIVSIVEERAPIETTITVDYIEVEAPKPAEIELDEAFPPIGEVNEQLNHTLLHNRDSADQHPIVAITGLREELDEIESLKSVYADKVNVANYYKWNTGAYDTAGYFVSLVPHSTTIKICDGTDIFGVTVDSAGFIGGQNEEIPRDNSYALVATSGLVDVRCESTVAEGDYVISNVQGMAEKTTSSCGYKVIAVNDDRTHDPGVLYATIALGVQACTTDAISKSVQHIEDRVDNNEINIAAAMNVANQAYNKAQESMAAGQIMGDQVSDALDRVDDMEADVENMGAQVGNIATITAQAKAIAESAATSAESMKNEAVEKANEALADASKLRKELEATVSEIDTDLENATLELEAVKESLETTKNGLQESIDDAVSDLEELAKDMEPLATWPEGSSLEDATGVAGFVARANKDSVTLASMVTWKGDAGDSLAGFVQEATEENATIKAVASYKRKDANGNVIEPGGAAGLIAQVDANQAVVQTVAALDGGLAGLEAKVKDNASSLTLLASQTIGDYVTVDIWSEVGKDTSTVYYAKDTKDYYYYKNNKWNQTKNTRDAGLDGAIAGVQSIADENKAELGTVASYSKNGKTGLAGLSAYVDEHEARVSDLASYGNKDSGRSGTAGLVADVNANTSTLSVVAQHSFTKDDGTVVTGLAGLQAQVEDNSSEVSLVANRVAGKYTVIDSWNATDKNENMVYYAKDTKLYWYYSNGWKKTTDAYVAGLPASMAGIQVVTDEHSSRINSLAAFDTDTTKNLARIEQKADANGAYIQSTVANIDKYSVGPYSQAYGFTLEQAKDVLEKGMVYVPTGTGTHSEKYAYIEMDSDGKEVVKNYPDDDGYQFTPGYTYTWSDIDSSEGTKTMMWKESVGKIVSFGTAPSGDAYDFWYTNSDEVSDGYEPYTLYKLEEYKNEANETLAQWIAVATLAGNSQSRAVSQIRQDANSIELSVTTLDDKYAGTKIWVDKNQSAIQDTVKWKSDNAESIATFMQEAGDNFASTSQVAKIVDKDGNINAASIVTAVNGSDSSVVINADHIKFEGFVSFASKDDVDEVKDNAVYDTKVEYALSSSSSEFIAVTGADGQWSTTAPAWRIDAYMWQKTTITKGDTSVASTQTCIQGAKGNDGTGIAIKGTAYIKDVVVSDAIIGSEYIIYKDAQCTTQITNAEDGDSYLIDGYLFVYSGAGDKFTCTGKIQGPAGETPTVSVSSDGYWVVNGTKLDTKAEGETPTVEINADGYWVINEEVTSVKAEGDAGVGVSNIINYYMASSRATGVVAGTSGETTDEQWTTDVQTVSEGKPYLWNYETTLYTNGDSKSTDPTIIGNYSKDGKGIQSIEEFYCISASGTCTTPTADTLNKAVSYSGTAVAGTWYRTSPPTDLTNKYLWNCERVTYTEGQPEIFAPALIGTHGEKGADGTGVAIKGSAYANVTVGDDIIGESYVLYSNEECTTAISEVSDGDAYLVEGYLFVYSGSGTKFICTGKIQGPAGANAPTVVSEKKQFYLSTSNTSCVGGSWADSPSGFQYSSNKYMWSRSVYTMSDDSIIEGNPALDKTYTTISNWCMENDETIINGAHIATGTIDADKISTNAIRSHNYPVDRDGNPIIPSSDDCFSSSGTFLDLSNGAFYSPNFAITNSGNAHFQGTVVAQEGEIAGWEITDQGLTKADTNIEIGLSPGNGGTYNNGLDNLGLVLYAGTKAPREPKAIAGTWRFTDESDVIKDFLRDAYLRGSVEFPFYGWFNHPTSGWTKYEGQNARLTFVYSGDEAFEITLSVDNSSAQMLWGCGSYNAVPWTSNLIGNYLLNREIGFGVEGIDDIWIGDYQFGTNILSSIATFIPGSIGMYPAMFDKDGRLYAQEVRLGGSADSVIEVGRCAVGNLIINNDAIMYQKGWGQAGGLYFGKDGLTVGENFRVQSQGVSTASVIVGGAANTHTEGTVACKILRATQEIIGTVNTSSDRNKKNSIEGLDERYDQFFDALEPQRFKYNNGTSDRYHIGYITQDVQDGLVQANLMEQEFAGIITIDAGTDTEESYLRYNEFVSLNTDQIQKLKKRVDALEAKNAELEERLAKLEVLLINNAE